MDRPLARSTKRGLNASMEPQNRREPPLLPVILAAGIGSRLGGSPKALFSIRGRALVDYCIDALAEQGFRRAVLVTGHRAADVRAHLEDAPLKCAFVHNDRFDDLNNFYSVRRAIEDSGGNTLLIVNCDVLFLESAVVAAIAVSTAALGLLVEQGVNDAEAMKVEVEHGSVVRLSKGIPPERAFGEFVGISTLAPVAQREYVAAADEALRAGTTHLYYEDVYSRICRNVDSRIAAIEPGEWAEVDAPHDVPAAMCVAERRSAANGPSTMATSTSTIATA